MSKKKKKAPRVILNRARPQESFTKLVTEATTHAVEKVIGQKIQQLGLQLAQNQARELSGVVTRLAVIEKVCMNELDITEEQLANLVAIHEDEAFGLEQVQEVKLGDTVRVSISAKEVDSKEKFEEPSKVQVTNVGKSPYTLPKEIEEGLVGLKDGDEAKIKFGTDQKMIAWITVDRISRKIKEDNEESTSSGE